MHGSNTGIQQQHFPEDDSSASKYVLVLRMYFSLNLLLLGLKTNQNIYLIWF
jgi:hypothetical protein